MNKILIIEDDLLVANIYRNKFSVEGFQVEVALDGHAGLELVRSFRPDAVLLDLMLPKIPGLELMKKIRAEPDFRELPVIVFSNTYLTNMIQDAWKAGATKCLSKANCTPKQVIGVVRTSLKPEKNLKPPGTQGGEPEPAVTVPGREETGDPDAEFQAELRKSLAESFPTRLAGLRSSLQNMVKAENENIRLKQVNELYRRVHTLTSNAGIAGMSRIAQMSDALEALLKELFEKPKNINASTLRTVASAVDFLGILFQPGPAAGAGSEPAESSVLVVDDEAISRRAITYALEKAKLKSVNVEDPLAALQMLAARRFDLIFLDVDMPNMSGFELCSRLRQLPAHAKTPVVFVTGLSDFENRANSTVSGGNDLIAKPFLFIELAVKALIYILRGRLEPPKS